LNRWGLFLRIESAEKNHDLDELSFPKGQHFTQAGHILITQLLEERLKMEGMLPAGNPN